ncbi:hypothetical protein [Pararhodobacter marinus]|uniref:hypothetical protein n=1 Tax=Pararhodobacter marinus TaxID=2184063 RepID=UPI00143D63D6|nr:hypothetical protein [Pararhodobacter marinus]
MRMIYREPSKPHRLRGATRAVLRVASSEPGLGVRQTRFRTLPFPGGARAA